jgi:hypothetical protein
MFWRYLIDCQISSLHLWTRIECAYCMATMLICLNVIMISMARSLSFVSNLFIDGMCVMALAPAAKTMSGTLHPLVMMLLTSGWYFLVFSLRAFATNLLL